MASVSIHRDIKVKTHGETEVVDITGDVRSVLEEAGANDGMVHVFVPGSTAGVTTIEYEPGCVADLQAAFERIAPRDGHYEHNRRWGDGNGFSHVRAAILGPLVSVPVREGQMDLGTWQQIILVDFDNRPRERRLVVSWSEH